MPSGPLIQLAASGSTRGSAGHLFRDYAAVWMKSQTAQDRNRRHLRTAPEETTSSRRLVTCRGLAAIRPTMVQQWVKDLQASRAWPQRPSRPSTSSSLASCAALSGTATSARHHAWTSGCRKSARPRPVAHPGQVLALTDAMPARYALLVLLGAGAGLRQGEAFGLALDRIDAAAGMMTVDQQVVVVDRRPVLAPPKTSASLRDVPMPRFVRRCGDRATSTGSDSASTTCCAARRGERFCGATTTTARSGSPRSAAAGTARRTRRSTTYGIPSPARPSPKACPISEVSRWLGHKSITTTVDLYGHLVPEASGRARDALDKAFAPPRRAGCENVPGMCPPACFLSAAHSAGQSHGEGASRPVGRVLCTRANAGRRPSIWDCRCRQPRAVYPRASGGPPSTARAGPAPRKARGPCDLAPGGVYQAARITPGAGGLLHHRFTLAPARPEPGMGRSVLCGTVPRVTPGRCYRPPCPVEPGPSSPGRASTSRRGRPAGSPSLKDRRGSGRSRSYPARHHSPAGPEPGRPPPPVAPVPSPAPGRPPAESMASLARRSACLFRSRGIQV